MKTHPDPDLHLVPLFPAEVPLNFQCRFHCINGIIESNAVSISDHFEDRALQTGKYLIQYLVVTFQRGNHLFGELLCKTSAAFNVGKEKCVFL